MPLLVDEVAQVPFKTTSEEYQLWAHGFALTASLYHSRDVLKSLEKQPSTIDALLNATGANSGHLAIMLRTLTTLGWVTKGQDGRYSTSAAVSTTAHSSTLAQLCADVYSEPEGASTTERDTSAEAWGKHLPRLAVWLERLREGLQLPAAAADVPRLLTMLGGAVIAPTLLELRMLASSYRAKAAEGAHEHMSKTVELAGLGAATAGQIGDFFAFQGWGAFDRATSVLTLSGSGLFIVERCPAFGVCLSYRPMLHQLTAASFGQTSDVFKYDGGHEAWVDRRLNVIGSGFMHNRYFSDMMQVYAKQVFDTTPLAEQPSVVADMGCGDGTLLKTIYLYVKQHTKRGKALDQYPLTMCGVDFNSASCEETALTLSAAGAPHGTMFGDIGDPIPMQAELEKKFNVTRDQVRVRPHRPCPLRSLPPSRLPPLPLLPPSSPHSTPPLPPLPGRASPRPLCRAHPCRCCTCAPSWTTTDPSRHRRTSTTHSRQRSTPRATRPTSRTTRALSSRRRPPSSRWSSTGSDGRRASASMGCSCLRSLRSTSSPRTSTCTRPRRCTSTVCRRTRDRCSSPRPTSPSRPPPPACSPARAR